MLKYIKRDKTITCDFTTFLKSFVGERLQVFYADADGFDWLEDHGTVGRICDTLNGIKLLDGGIHHDILRNAVMRVINADTGHVLWEHPDYQQPNLRISQNPKTGTWELRRYDQDELYLHVVDTARSRLKLERAVAFYTGKPLATV